ncbi:MAG: hypothetical protein ABIH63_04135 [archaeon]
MRRRNVIKESGYVTTRQAAGLLGVSLSTAMRMFDKGILSGDKNKITYRRKVDLDSVEKLASSFGINPHGRGKARGKHFSTGEAAVMLEISRSTVSRMFDKGVLYGVKNPLTHERMVSFNSIKKLADSVGLEIQKEGGES